MGVCSPPPPPRPLLPFSTANFLQPVCCHSFCSAHTLATVFIIFLSFVLFLSLLLHQSISQRIAAPIACYVTRSFIPRGTNRQTDTPILITTKTKERNRTTYPNSGSKDIGLSSLPSPSLYKWKDVGGTGVHYFMCFQ